MNGHPLQVMIHSYENRSIENENTFRTDRANNAAISANTTRSAVAPIADTTNY